MSAEKRDDYLRLPWKYVDDVFDEGTGEARDRWNEPISWSGVKERHYVECVNALHASGLPLSVLPLVPELIEAAKWYVRFMGRESASPDDGEQWEAVQSETKDVLARIAAATEGEG